MKDLKRIEELLEKYYEGRTSTTEEEELRRFFTKPDVPGHLLAEAGLFRFFEKERYPGASRDMEMRLERSVSGQGPGRKGIEMNRRYYLISGVAAAILILAGIFIDMQIRKNSSLVVRKDTYEDPYLAYAEAKRVLYLVSEKMNTAREPLKNFEKLNEGINYMQPVLSFGTGIQYLENFSRIEETRKLISKQ